MNLKFRYVYRNISNNEIVTLIQDIEEIELSRGVHHNELELIDRLMFTGYKDRDGNEIYEGDILRPNNSVEYEVAVVYFNYGRWEFGNGTLYDAILHAGVHVIGNIYENPEIMEEHHKMKYCSHPEIKIVDGKHICQTCKKEVDVVRK